MKKIFALGGAILLLSILLSMLLAFPLVALAQHAHDPTTSDMSKDSPYCQQYFQNLAKRLNISISDLKQAKVGARSDALAQLVKDGKLTQNQADQISQSLDKNPMCRDKAYRAGVRDALRATLKKYMPGALSQIAQGLNLSTSQLQSDLQNGQTLSQIAKAQNVSESQLQTLVLNTIQSTMTQAQKAGDLTAQQSSTIQQYFQKHPDRLEKLLNRSFKK